MILRNSAHAVSIRVVLADANVLYSRVLRDYLLYAAAENVLQIRWSALMLDEMTRHLVANIPKFDATAAQRLTRAMNTAFPAAEVIIDDVATESASTLRLPDEGDRHVIAAAIATGADVLCTDNLKDFPTEAMEQVGIRVLSADALLLRLILEFPSEMRTVHGLCVSHLRGATDESTLNALTRAGAIGAAEHMRSLIRYN